MKSIALVTAYGWVGISSPLINTALHLNSLGYWIDIYIKDNGFCNDMGLGELSVFDNKNIGIKSYKKLENTKNKQLFIKNMEELDELIFEDLKYKFLIGFDPEGLIKAGIIGKFSKIPYIYFSLEIYEKEDALKKLERYFAKSALFTITQDVPRIKILSNLNNIEEKNFKFIWNSSLDENILTEKKDYFRDKFNISKKRKIILATGTLLPITGIDKLIESALQWDENFVLVLHGWIPSKSFATEIVNKIKNSNKIFLSTDLIAFESKYIIFQSVDIGFVYYSEEELNLKYAAGSSGKLFDFMKAGVPIIGNRIPNMDSYINENKCGIVFDNIFEIKDLIYRINENYDEYKNNSYTSFSKYSFKDSFNLTLKGLL